MTTRTADQTPLYNSRIVETYGRLVAERYPQVDLREALRAAGMKSYQVKDEEHWFAAEQVNRFHQILVEATGNPHIAREAGRYCATPGTLGSMRDYLLGLLDPANVFASLQRLNANLSRATKCETESLARDRCAVTVTPLPGVEEQPFHCANRIGFFEAVPLLFRFRLRQVEHPECVLRGDRCCRYVIAWRRPSQRWKRGRNWSLLFFGLLCLIALGLDSGLAVMTVLPLTVSAALGINLLYERRLKKEMKFTLGNVRLATDKLLEQVEINHNNTLLANEIGQAISRQTNLDDILDNVVQVLEKRLDYSRGMILLRDAEQSRLVFRAGFGYVDEQLALLKHADFRLDRPESRGIFVVCYREQRPFLINDFSDIEQDLSRRSQQLAQKLGAKSFLCCPIISEGETVGILAADNLRSNRPLVQSDLTLLMGVASFIGISLHNADLLEASACQSRSILQTLASSIDARDPLTAGHSEKVTEYALGICDQIGLEQDYRELVRVSAMLHDYGKIGVPDAILKKDGRLTASEYASVKTHAAKTREILEQIHFMGIFRQVPEIAGAHHEKIDGSGYPEGRKGKDIPLGAKIIAVADYFEAITAKRHYRDPMPQEEAFAQLRAGSGRHFEPYLVEAFIAYFRRTRSEVPPQRVLQRPHGDRRRLRVPYQAPVSLRVNGITTSATSADLSASGIFVATSKEPPEGAQIELSFPLATGETEWVRASGRVAWVNSGQAMKKPRFPVGFGIEFLELGVGATEAIQALIGSAQVPDLLPAAL